VKDQLFSEEAEISILGGLLLSAGKVLSEVQDVVTSEDFALVAHQIIYDAICTLDADQRSPDGVVVGEYLQRQGQLGTVGGLDYLGKLIDNTLSATNVRAYAKIVKSYSLRRALARTGQQIADLAANDQREVDEVVSEAQRLVLAVGAEDAKVGPKMIGQLMPAWMDALDTRCHQTQGYSGVSTGLVDLDKKINGLQRGNLIVIAGRPSSGKSALAFNILNHIATLGDQPVLAFSLEMSGAEIITRSIAQFGKVAVDRLMAGNLSDEEWPKIDEASGKVIRSKMLLDESASLVLPQIRARARRVYQKYGKLGAIMVDYLQLIQAETHESRVQQLAEITRGLKVLAKELDVPVLLLSQLNREVEKREDKRPRLSDLRDGGSVEQDADVVLFLYRDVMYNQDTMFKRVAEAIVGKQRNGPTGTVLLYYFPEYTMFASMEHDAQRSFWSERYGRKSADDFDDYR
jgi:replicative DNA helicase